MSSLFSKENFSKFYIFNTILCNFLVIARKLHLLDSKIQSIYKWSYLNVSNISLILFISLSCRDYFSGDLYDSEQKLTDKVVIVTGANTGIGKEVVRDLAKREAKVIMACRDMEKCESVLILLLVYYHLVIYN